MKLATSITVRLTPNQKKQLIPIAEKIIHDNFQRNKKSGLPSGATCFIGQPQTTDKNLMYGFDILKIGILPQIAYKKVQKIMGKHLIKFPINSVKEK